MTAQAGPPRDGVLVDGVLELGTQHPKENDEIGMEGSPPVLAVGQGNPEAQKYGRLWDLPEYRERSPGEDLVQLFISQARPKPGATVLDLGCGTGRAGMLMAVLAQVRVTLVDFVRNCLDPEVREACTTQPEVFKFLKHDLEQPLPVVANYGFCCDVMEHVPEVRVDRVFENILHAAAHVFFSISTVDDPVNAELAGGPVHLTVQRYTWWLQRLARLGCVVHWSQDLGHAALFYVSAWSSGHEIVSAGVPNVTAEEIVKNVEQNIAAGWQQVVPHPANDVEVAILGGSPSLGAFEGTIRALQKEGVKLVTLNGAYGWAHERGLWPVTQVMVDARAFNARFVQPVDPACRYLLASQCHPAVFEGLPPDRTLLWHTIGEEITPALAAHYGQDAYYRVPGGSTVLLRAIPLLRMLGFRRFHLFGCDSCLAVPEADGAAVSYPASATGAGRAAHHAYAQPENDGGAFPAMVEGRIFWCQPWMISQAQEFCSLIAAMGDEFELEVYGDGLLAHILKTGAYPVEVEAEAGAEQATCELVPAAGT